MGTLYVVGTPIGNLEDLSPRALRVLREVSLVAAEDTRKTGVLFARFDVHTPLTSYFEHNKLRKLDAIIEALARGDVALVSEAGMPGLSDPGYELIHAAIQAGYPVVPIPGPVAAITALVVSGLPTDSFVFLGFLARQASERKRTLQEVASEKRTLVLYEAPHRLAECLADLEALLGDRPIAVARELTKLHEEIYRGTVRGAREHFAPEAHGEVRGELTLVIGGAPEQSEMWDDERVRRALREAIDAGMDRKEAVRLVTQASGRPRREVYRQAIELP
jgi:16S rRNA (cytidine1402-2'-O)-methyltransferase